MIRLFYIEWLKLARSRYFKWMMGAWLLSFLIVPLGVDQFLAFIERLGEFSTNEFGITPSSFPIFSFHDIWHNLAYVYKLTTVFLCIIVIVNVGQEWEEKTIRQNVIDGMSRMEYFLSKMILLFGLTLASTFLLFLLGIIMGITFDQPLSWSGVTEHLDFLLGYGMHLFLHLSLAMLFVNIFRKIGLTVLLFMAYMYIIEPMVLGIFFLYMAEEQGWINYLHYFPFEASWRMVPSIPFQKYIMMYIPGHIEPMRYVVALSWTAAVFYFNSLLTTKRDLR